VDDDGAVVVAVDAVVDVVVVVDVAVNMGRRRLFVVFWFLRSLLLLFGFCRIVLELVCRPLLLLKRVVV
jgi:hypothetical protein